jgi:ribosomal protein L7/L12
MAKLKHEDILAFLEEASILELNELVKAIEEKFGVTAAAPVAMAAAPAEAEQAGPTSVSVILTSFGESKTGVIKLVKEITGLGLVEAKGLVDKCPSPIKENISVDEAEELKKKFMDAGATVDIK